MPSRETQELRHRITADLGEDLLTLVEKIRVAAEQANTTRATLNFLRELTKTVLAEQSREAEKRLREQAKQARQARADGDADAEPPRITDSVVDAEARASKPYRDHLAQIREVETLLATQDAEMYRYRNLHDSLVEMLRYRRGEMAHLHGTDQAARAERDMEAMRRQVTPAPWTPEDDE